MVSSNYIEASDEYSLTTLRPISRRTSNSIRLVIHERVHCKVLRLIRSDQNVNADMAVDCIQKNNYNEAKCQNLVSR